MACACRACGAITLTISPAQSGRQSECVSFKTSYVFKMCCTIPANSIKCSCGVAVWLRSDVNGRLVD